VSFHWDLIFAKNLPRGNLPSLFGGLSQVKEKSRRICITGVYLVPQAGKFASLEITCNKGGLPTTGRSGDPDQRMFPHPVQETKQPLPGKNPRKDGTGYLAHRFWKSILL